jgi:SagB-type dehydrogenase family enzyme
MRVATLLLFSISAACAQPVIGLPDPIREGRMSIEECLELRRSVRTYAEPPLTIAEAGQLLWAAQGITAAGKFRTAPSAGALYPLETYLIAGNVTKLRPGIYKYRPARHELLRVAEGDRREALAGAALGQDAIRRGAAVIFFSAVYARTAARYKDRAARYVHIEAGHAAQNICLQAVALKLGVVPIGAFSDEEVKRALKLPEDEEPLYILPTGRR